MTIPKTVAARPLLAVVTAALRLGAAVVRGVSPDATLESAQASGPPGADSNPNKHQTGDKSDGREVFRMETFGNEGFWTDALRLPAGMVAAKLTPIDALKRRWTPT